MAERRMFAKTIIDSDAFLDMPLSAQALYFHLGMRADDDGFVNSPKRIMRLVSCSEDDMKLLITKKFIIPFDSGIVVIKHWKIHNYIPKDRYHETKYLEEKSQLRLKENGSYTTLDTPCIQDVYEMDTETRLGKDSLDKSCSYKAGKDFIDFLEILSCEEIETLKRLYADAYELIDEATNDAVKKGKIITTPFAYIVGYATNRGWLEQNGKDK